jgi:hypothetical protein
MYAIYAQPHQKSASITWILILCIIGYIIFYPRFNSQQGTPFDGAMVCVLSRLSEISASVEPLQVIISSLSNFILGFSVLRRENAGDLCCLSCRCQSHLYDSFSWIGCESWFHHEIQLYTCICGQIPCKFGQYYPTFRRCIYCTPHLTCNWRSRGKNKPNSKTVRRYTYDTIYIHTSIAFVVLQILCFSQYGCECTRAWIVYASRVCLHQ